MSLHRPLHELDQITMTKQLKEKTLKAVMAKKRKKKNNLFVMAGAIVCVFLVILLPYQKKQSSPLPSPSSPYAYVSLDINPSLELVLDQEKQVMDVIAYNADGEAMIQAVNPQGYGVVEAIHMLVNSDAMQSYMQDGFLQVSVYADDRTLSTVLEKEIDSALAAVLSQDQYHCGCASQQDRENASQHHMSFGRYQKIEEILALDNSYTLEELENYSMQELQSLYREVTGGSNMENGHHMGDENGHHGRNHS